MSMLDKYKNISDLQNMDKKTLQKLSMEIRLLIMKRCSTVGGHLATNLANVEMTMMLYRHFSPNNGYIVFDGAHQGYTHKILTDRKDIFLNKDKVGTPIMATESKYDTVTFGHGGFGASVLCGMARFSNKPCVLFLSDGMLGNGIEYEGLCQLATLNRNVVVVVNDNNHAILNNSGGEYNYIGKDYFNVLGFEYIEVKNGYDLDELDNAYTKAFKINNPIVVHVHTIKGYGYKFAKENPTKFHYVDTNFDIIKGNNHYADSEYLNIIDNHIYQLMQNDDKICAMTVAMPDVGFGNRVQSIKDRYYNVGITEEHAFVEACGLSLAGKYPIIGTYSTFLQRMYDSMLNCGEFNHVNMTILMHESGIRDNNIYQNGVYDISIINQMQNAIELFPTNVYEICDMVTYTTQHKGIYIIRIPNDVDLEKRNYTIDDLNKYIVINESKNTDLYVLCFGYNSNAQIISEKYNCNLYYAPSNQLDYEFLNDVKKSKLLITFEDGIVNGGIGNKISDCLSLDNVKVYNIGLRSYDYFNNPNNKNMEEIYKENHMDINSICKIIDGIIK